MATFTDEDDEFEFDDGDEGDWGELEEYDEAKENMDKIDDKMETNKCWKCKNCDTINNIKVTLETNDMTCCKCHKDQYIPDQTQIIVSTKWKTKSDFEWHCLDCNFTHNPNNTNYCEKCKTLNPLSKSVWRCSYCTFINGDATTGKCGICNNPRPSIINSEKGTVTFIPSKRLSDSELSMGIANNWVKFYNDTYSDHGPQKYWSCSKCYMLNLSNNVVNHSIDNSSKCFWCSNTKNVVKVKRLNPSIWKCDNCDFKNTRNRWKCSGCWDFKCHAISKYGIRQLIEILISGYFRRMFIQKYGNDSFLSHDYIKLCIMHWEFGGIEDKFGSKHYPPKYPQFPGNPIFANKLNSTIYTHYESGGVWIFGNIICRKGFLYQWKVKVSKANLKHGEIILRHRFCSFGIARKGKYVTNYELFSDGLFGLQQYCPTIRNGSIITIELDMRQYPKSHNENGTLAFGLNGFMFPTAAKINLHEEYRLRVDIETYKLSVEIVDFFSID